MTLFQSIILGIVQGLTEFLPVSSSGHLVITSKLLHVDIPAHQAFLFYVLVQVATLVAVISYFWKDLFTIGKAMLVSMKNNNSSSNSDSKLGWLILVATIPAGVAGLVFKRTVEITFSDFKFSGFALMLTAFLLVIAEKLGKKNRTLENMGWLDSIWIGFSQIISIFPGVSRSGSTISGGMIKNFDRQSAARFSFLMSIPIMFAAGIFATFDLLKQPFAVEVIPSFIPGFISAAITGYLTIKWLLKYLTNHSLYIFAAYCVLVGLFVILI